MSIKKITYTNKTAIQNDTSIADENKVTDNDMNEIKQVVNNNADELSTAQSNIEDLQSGQGTANTDITNLKSRVSTLETDNTANKSDISTLKSDNVTNKENISTIKQDISDIKNDNENFIINSISENIYNFNIEIEENKLIEKYENILIPKGQLLNFKFNFNNILNENKINVIFYNKNNEQIDLFAYNGTTSTFILKNENATKIKFYCSPQNILNNGEINCKIVFDNNSILNTNYEINFKNVLKSLFDYNLNIINEIKTNTTYSKSSPIFIPKNIKAKFLFTSDAVDEDSNMVLGFTYDSGDVNNVATIKVNLEKEIIITDNIQAITCYIPAKYIIQDGMFSLNISLFKDGIVQEVQLLSAKTNNNLNISILGDSISTYNNWNPEGYTPWYSDDGNYNESNDISDVKQTWWYKIINELKATLLINSSYSGTTICNTGYNGNDSSEHSFITRMKNDIGEKKVLQSKPNLIFVFGGTNDTWAGSPVGNLKYNNWTDEDLKSTLPAFCYMIDYLQKWNPGCRIINIINVSVSEEIKQGMITACEYYSIENIVLENISLAGGHPNQEGMTQIKEQIIQKFFN